MTMLKTALKNLVKTPVMNTICLLQLTAVFLVTAVMISTMSIRYRLYTPLKDILESKGFFADYNTSTGVCKPGGDPGRDVSDMVFSNEALREYMTADRTAMIRRFPMLYNREVEIMYLYDRELAEQYAPELKRGRWMSSDADELEVVIPEGLFGLDVGDEAEVKMIMYTQDLPPIKIKVVGVLEDNFKLLGHFQRVEDTNDSYRCLYYPLSKLAQSAAIASSEAMDRLYPQAEEIFIHAVFYMYDDITDEELKQQMKLAGEMKGNIVLSLEYINQNSREYLKNELLKLLPIVVILLILVTISSISVSAIAARQRLRDYAKYYLLGLQWRQCALVNLFQALMIGAAALLIACAGLVVVGATGLSDTFMIIWNAPMFMSLLGVLALYLAFSMIMPLLMLRSNSPKALLQTE